MESRHPEIRSGEAFELIGNGNEFLCLRVEPVQSVVVCPEPQISVGIFIYGKHPVMRQVGEIAGEHYVVDE